ncbi:BTB/POZ domain-containing protein [Candidatus Protochlamydia amoebophila]|uniref:BTB/POZ domain-containing protein n=1 Tax=Candidatus Protochlamydia amoebophila TaxID=362787 RepID=UPI002016226D|nr:BTB/POZ domain-containing protein [Candidatus Protochlamydia amoebophila]
MNIHNPRVNPSNLLVNADTHSYFRSNNHLKFSERIHLLCKTIFQSFLNLFFNYLEKEQLQSQWREIFWGQKEITIPKFIASRLASSDISLTSSSQTLCDAPPFSTRTRTQETMDNLEDENKLLLNPLTHPEELNASEDTFPKKIESSTQPSVFFSSSPELRKTRTQETMDNLEDENKLLLNPLTHPEELNASEDTFPKKIESSTQPSVFFSSSPELRKTRTQETMDNLEDENKLLLNPLTHPEELNASEDTFPKKIESSTQPLGFFSSLQEHRRTLTQETIDKLEDENKLLLNFLINLEALNALENTSLKEIESSTQPSGFFSSPQEHRRTLTQETIDKLEDENKLLLNFLINLEELNALENTSLKEIESSTQPSVCFSSPQELRRTRTQESIDKFEDENKLLLNPLTHPEELNALENTSLKEIESSTQPSVCFSSPQELRRTRTQESIDKFEDENKLLLNPLTHPEELNALENTSLKEIESSTQPSVCFSSPQELRRTRTQETMDNLEDENKLLLNPLTNPKALKALEDTFSREIESSTQPSDFVSSPQELRRTRTQETMDNLEDENKLLLNPLTNPKALKALEDPSPKKMELSPQPSICFSSPQKFKLRFQDETSLNTSYSQLALLREKSPYFKSLWSGNFRETLQDPLTLTQTEFTHLLNCLKYSFPFVPLEDILSLIQLADYYQLSEVEKKLEKQLIEAYKSQKLEPFNSSEDSLLELKALLNFAQQYRLNVLKSYLVDSLLNQTSQLTEFEKILKYFSNEIEELNFSKNIFLTDAHLLALKNCKNLKVLHLQKCHNLTDAGLAHLAPLMALQHLNLAECNKITDAGLAHLRPLVALTHLNLKWCRNLTDAGLAHLTSLVALKYLDLSYCSNFTDAGLTHLTPLVALQHLDLDCCRNFTDAGLAHLRPLVALTHLNLSWCHDFTDAGLAHLTPLVALQYLNLSLCWRLTDAGLAHLTPLVALTHLDLSSCNHLTDAGLAHLTPLVALQHLDLNSCKKLTDAGLAHLTPLVALQHLNLSWCDKLTDAGLAHLTPLVALQDLYLYSCENFTEVGLAHFKSSVASLHLNLKWCKRFQ